VEGVNYGQALRQLNRFGVEGVLGHHIGTTPAQLFEEALEGSPEGRPRRELISRSGHQQRLVRAGLHWNLNAFHPRHLRAFGAVELDIVSTLGQTSSKVA
jgi:hypothetical protein